MEREVVGRWRSKKSRNRRWGWGGGEYAGSGGGGDGDGGGGGKGRCACMSTSFGLNRTSSVGCAWSNSEISRCTAGTSVAAGATSSNA